jgi:3-deoxy-D-manno-octulosonic-acid transferase
MPKAEKLYTAAIRAVAAISPLAARGNGKLARGIQGRRGVIGRMEAWAADRTAGDPGPRVWFHAPSVGEGLQARAVMEELRRRRPDVGIIYTYFSPSAERFAAQSPADFADFLPLDTPRQMERAMAALRPSAVVFSKSDVWPNLTAAASRGGVPMALLSATLPASSSRLSRPARALLGPAYRRLDRIAAISAEDAARFAAFGVPAQGVSVMGDAHFDRVLAHAEAPAPIPELLRRLAGEPDDLTIVAGSTWGADEDRIIPAVASMSGSPRRPRLALVPHEPGPAHLRGAEERIAREGLRARRLSDLDGQWDGNEVLLVDRVGVLGHLYRMADIAYVGGGWGAAGLHSVLEPAAFGLPIVFGRRHANAREAGELIAAGGAFTVASREDLTDRLTRLLIDPSLRKTAGTASRAYVEAGRGAADRGAAIVQELLDSR